MKKLKQFFLLLAAVLLLSAPSALAAEGDAPFGMYKFPEKHQGFDWLIVDCRSLDKELAQTYPKKRIWFRDFGSGNEGILLDEGGRIVYAAVRGIFTADYYDDSQFKYFKDGIGDNLAQTMCDELPTVVIELRNAGRVLTVKAISAMFLPGEDAYSYLDKVHFRDIVISAADADTIFAENEKTNFLQKRKVVFLHTHPIAIWR